jgi:hypothetical protein
MKQPVDMSWQLRGVLLRARRPFVETYKSDRKDGLEMAGRDRVALVCRDCGEVAHVQLAGLKADGLVSCGACGLVLDARHLRGPPTLPRPQALGDGGGTQVRRGPGARLRR